MPHLYSHYLVSTGFPYSRSRGGSPSSTILIALSVSCYQLSKIFRTEQTTKKDEEMYTNIFICSTAHDWRVWSGEGSQAIETVCASSADPCCVQEGCSYPRSEVLGPHLVAFLVIVLCSYTWEWILVNEISGRLNAILLYRLSLSTNADGLHISWETCK